MARRRPDDYEDDDYDDRPPRRKPGSDGGSSALKIIALIGGILVAVLLVCGGLAAFFFYTVFRTAKDMQQQMVQQLDKMQQEQSKREAEEAKTDRGQASKFAESFLKEIRDGQLDAAYQATTADYQKRVPRKDFELLVLKSPGLKWFAPRFETDLNAPAAGNRFVFRFTAPAEGKVWHPSLTVVKDGLNWKVDDLNAGG
jgi:hypothetical protein